MARCVIVSEPFPIYPSQLPLDLALGFDPEFLNLSGVSFDLDFDLGFGLNSFVVSFDFSDHRTHATGAHRFAVSAAQQAESVSQALCSRDVVLFVALDSEPGPLPANVRNGDFDFVIHPERLPDGSGEIKSHVYFPSSTLRSFVFACPADKQPERFRILFDRS